jgi:hypothetical protein
VSVALYAEKPAGLRSSQERGASAPREARAPQKSYDDLYFTEQPYGLVFGFETGLPVSDSSSAVLT